MIPSQKSSSKSLMALPARKLIQRALAFPKPDGIKVFIDLMLIALAAFWAWFVSFGQLPNPGSPWPFLFVVLGARIFIHAVMRIHHASWLHVSRFEVLKLALSAALGPVVIALLIGILPNPFTLRTLVRPVLILLTEPALYLLLLCGARITARAIYNNHLSENKIHSLLIVGAGAAGRALAFQIREQEPIFDIIGFIDDSPRLQNRQIRGLRVLGTIAELPRLARDLQAREIAIAIPSLQPERLREILALCEPLGLPIRILPPLRELMGAGGKRVNAAALREVRMEDLLPRPELKLDHEAVKRYLENKSVLVTGGGGSIGSELCRQALTAGAKSILVLGRGENSVFEIAQELNESKGECQIVPLICDVRDRDALQRIFARYTPQVVFHAAAHKHVPLMEDHPCEAVKNNVLGTLNVVELSIAHKVESFVLVSTDKAVEPCNVMGATKRLCEMIVKAHATHNSANMVAVRFGNVLGSRGSVVPTMQRQIQRRLPVTVTDPDMVRFFMTIPEAVQLVLQAGSMGGCGEVYVLDMGRPVKILDLAYDLIRLSGLVPDQDIPVRIIGRRPGEKMHEDILSTAEASSAQKKGAFYVAATEQVTLGALQAKIEELRAMSHQGNDEQVVAMIRDLVPEFNPEARGGSGVVPRAFNGVSKANSTGNDISGPNLEGRPWPQVLNSHNRVSPERAEVV